MSVRITDVKVLAHNNLELCSVHGYVRLDSRRKILNALQHTGFAYFDNFNEEYLRVMLIGRLAHVDKHDCTKKKSFTILMKQRRIFTYKFQRNKNK